MCQAVSVLACLGRLLCWRSSLLVVRQCRWPLLASPASPAAASSRPCTAMAPALLLQHPRCALPDERAVLSLLRPRAAGLRWVVLRGAGGVARWCGGGVGMGRRSICRCCGKTQLEHQLTPPTPLHAGKKHISLLRSLVADRGSVLPLHTILEVFR